MAEAGILYGVETLLEGAVAVAKGLYDPTLPLKAGVRPVTDIEVRRAFGTVCVVKGRGYAFCGLDGDEVCFLILFTVCFFCFRTFLELG